MFEEGWLYVTNFGRDTLYRNNGDGTFSNRTLEAGVGSDSWGTSAGFGDFDEDGYPDLYVTNYVNFTKQRSRILRRRHGCLGIGCSYTSLCRFWDRLSRLRQRRRHGHLRCERTHYGRTR